MVKRYATLSRHLLIMRRIMTELQTEQDLAPEIQDEITEQTEQEAVTGDSDLAPDTGENQEEKPKEGEPLSEGAQQAINKQHKKYRDEERARLEAERKASELEQRLQELEGNRPEPQIPPAPDPFDDDYEEKIRQRDEAIAARVRYESEQQMIASAHQQAQHEQQLARQRRDEENAKALVSNSAKHGISENDLVAAAQTVGSYRLNPEIVQGLMADEDGGLMIAYLAENPLELDNLRSMDLYSATRLIHSDIRKRAGSFKKQSSSAPEPPDVLRGGGAPEKDELPNGVGYKLE